MPDEERSGDKMVKDASEITDSQPATKVSPKVLIFKRRMCIFAKILICFLEFIKLSVWFFFAISQIATAIFNIVEHIIYDYNM